MVLQIWRIMELQLDQVSKTNIITIITPYLEYLQNKSMEHKTTNKHQFAFILIDY